MAKSFRHLQNTIISAEPGSGVSTFLVEFSLDDLRKGRDTLLVLNGTPHVRYLFQQLTTLMKSKFTADSKNFTLTDPESGATLKIVTRDDKVQGQLFHSVYMDRVSSSDYELEKFQQACTAKFVFAGPCEFVPESVLTELSPFLNYGVFDPKFSGVQTKSNTLLLSMLQDDNPWISEKEGQHYKSLVNSLPEKDRKRLYSWIKV